MTIKLRLFLAKVLKIYHFLNSKKAFSLVEVSIVSLTLSIVVYAMINVYQVGFDLWNDGKTQLDTRDRLDQAFALTSKNLRQAKSIDSFTASSITYTADLGLGDQSFRMYLYNSADAEPNPPYSSDTYELRWAKGSINYGDGAILVSNIQQPTTTPFLQTNNLITVDLTVANEGKSYRFRTNIRPRNL